MITEARFTNPENSAVAFTDDGVDYTSNYPTGNHWQSKLDAFGIDPYDEYYGVTDEKLRDQAYQLNADQAQGHINAAEMTPSDGVVLTDPRQKDKENNRRNNRAKRNAGMTSQDDAMADYVDAVMDTQVSADDICEALTLRQDLIDWDGSVMTYPVWTPPV